MILIILSVYCDGEVKEIIGYKTNESKAEKIVKKLNNTVAKGDNFHYTYELVDKL